MAKLTKYGQQMGDKHRGITCQTCGADSWKDTIISALDLTKPRPSKEDTGFRYICERCFTTHNLVDNETNFTREFQNYLNQKGQ